MIIHCVGLYCMCRSEKSKANQYTEKIIYYIKYSEMYPCDCGYLQIGVAKALGYVLLLVPVEIVWYTISYLGLLHVILCYPLSVTTLISTACWDRYVNISQCSVISVDCLFLSMDMFSMYVLWVSYLYYNEIKVQKLCLDWLYPSRVIMLEQVVV